MTDPYSPTTQFHPYERPRAVPVADREKSTFGRALESGGIDPAKVRSFLDRSRAWARRHPGRVFGGVAAAVLLVSLIRSRVSDRAIEADEEE